MNLWAILGFVGLTILNIFIATSGNLLSDYIKSGKLKGCFGRIYLTLKYPFLLAFLALILIFMLRAFVFWILETDSIKATFNLVFYVSMFILQIYNLLIFMKLDIQSEMDKEDSKILNHVWNLLGLNSDSTTPE